MSSSSENDSGAEVDTINGDVANGEQRTPADEESNNGRREGGRIVELLQEEREGTSTPQKVGNGTKRYRAAQPVESASEDGSMDDVPRRAESPIESVLSIPDDSPSVQVG
jgi:vacuolar protein sorting-associated protein 8